MRRRVKMGTKVRRSIESPYFWSVLIAELLLEPGGQLDDGLLGALARSYSTAGRLFRERLHNSESECQDLLYKTPEQHPLGRDDGSTIHCVQNSRRPLLQLYNIRLLALSDRQIRPLLNARSTTWRCWQASAARHLRQSTRLDKIKNIRIKIQLGSVGSTGDSLRQYQDSIGNRV